MPVTISGLASGVDTDSIVNKLLQVESRPLVQLEETKHKSSQRKDALQQLTKYLNDLNDKSHNLYGFRASFDDKKALVADTTSFDAVASRNANPTVRQVQVISLAASHKITTDPFEEKAVLPAGMLKIEVGGESRMIRFGGGSLKALRDRIDEEASESVSASYINTEGSKHIVTMESKKSGKNGEIKISGDREFLGKIGLIKGEKEKEKTEVGVVFDKRYLTGYIGEKKTEKQDGSVEVGDDGKAVNIHGLLWQDYALPAEVEIKDDTVFEFDLTYKNPEKEEDDLLPRRVEIGPEEKINVKGIELRGYNVSRIRPVEKKPKKEFESVLGVGVASVDKGVRTEKLYSVNRDAKGKQMLPVGKDFKNKKISKIIFYCNEGIAGFSNAKITTPVMEKELYEAKNVIAKAANAKVKVDGIEIERDKNSGLNDVVKGVTLNLKRPSDHPVDLKIERDIDKAYERIREFVDSYNKYLDYHKTLTKTEKLEKPDDFKNKKRGSRGLFVGDMVLNRLEGSMKKTVNNAYPSRAENPIKIFPQLGVSTGKINSEWESIKEGKLVIDEEVLKKALRENPEGVRTFFASDNDGDNRDDNGMAWTLSDTLKPYVSYGKNIINTKMSGEDETIKLANERIDRHQEHLKKYEEKLRRKFATMEKAMKGAEAQKRWMSSQMGETSGKSGVQK